MKSDEVQRADTNLAIKGDEYKEQATEDEY